MNIADLPLDPPHRLAVQLAPSVHHGGMPGYAQASQDLFALWVCGRGGVFLDIGAFNPCCLNNTLLLEHYGWSGESLEQDATYADLWGAIRRTPLIVGDALPGLVERIDRLKPDFVSIDIDAANMEAVSALAAARHRPRCVTIETNEYLDGGRESSAVVSEMESAGFIVSAPAVCACGIAFETWFVTDPDAVVSKKPGVEHSQLVCEMLSRGLDSVLRSRG